MNNWPIVEPADTPPAGAPGKCGWCSGKHGEPHDPDCVTVLKRVRIRMTVEYEVMVPHSWDKDAIEFQRNEGSWCASNAIAELSTKSCLCGMAHFDYVEDVDLTPVRSRDR